MCRTICLSSVYSLSSSSHHPCPLFCCVFADTSERLIDGCWTATDFIPPPKIECFDTFSDARDVVNFLQSAETSSDGGFGLVGGLLEVVVGQIDPRFGHERQFQSHPRQIATICERNWNFNMSGDTIEVTGWRRSPVQRSRLRAALWFRNGEFLVVEW